MKNIVILASLLATIIFSACDKRNVIDVYETSSTPDLSNPVVQKLTNVTWYKRVGIENTVVWPQLDSKRKLLRPLKACYI